MPSPRSSSRIHPATFVQEVSIVCDGDDRPRVVLQEALPTRRLIRRRDGWWARPAGAGPASEAEAGTGPTLRRSPPESLVTSASPGGRRSASIAISRARVDLPGVARVDGILHACLLRQELLHLLAGQVLCESGIYVVEGPQQSLVSRTPSSTFPSTSLAGSSCGSCGRKSNFCSLGGERLRP